LCTPRRILHSTSFGMRGILRGAVLWRERSNYPFFFTDAKRNNTSAHFLINRGPPRRPPPEMNG
jgi:hypothetical protein